MTQVIYARVPDSLKEAADEYAQAHALSLTAAVVDLLERGLNATDDERAIEELRSRVGTSTAERASLEAQLEVANARSQYLGALTGRIEQPVGRCPACSTTFNGYQLLAVGHCECGAGLTNLIAGHETDGPVDGRELLLLLGALGAVVGVAWLANKTTRES